MTARGIALLDTLVVPAGRTGMGSTTCEIEHAVHTWGTRLLDADYTPKDLRSWLSKEYPAHDVSVAAVRMGRMPVTQREYSVFVSQTGHRLPTSGLAYDAHPVWGVDKDDADAYCRWLALMTGLPVRMPTELEWEWAARGPERREFPWGERFDPSVCNTAEAGRGAPVAVGTFLSGASWCGLLDLGGNVEEWVGTDYAPYPGGASVCDDLMQRYPGGYRVLRGGSCALTGDAARGARRHGGPLPGERFCFTGFRIAIDIAAPSGASS